MCAQTFACAHIVLCPRLAERVEEEEEGGAGHLLQLHTRVRRLRRAARGAEVQEALLLLQVTAAPERVRELSQAWQRDMKRSLAGPGIPSALRVWRRVHFESGTAPR